MACCAACRVLSARLGRCCRYPETEDPIPNRIPRRALLLAPRGRDAAVAEQLLGEAGIDHVVPCRDAGAFVGALADDVTFAVATEESLGTADLRGIAAWVTGQPAWSDL